MDSDEKSALGTTRSTLNTGWLERCRRTLAERDEKKLRRTLRITARRDGDLNLADNDYLDLARDPALAAAVVAAVAGHGTSASASPLITGWREPHAQLVEALCAWHGFPCGLLWSSGYAANSAVLGGLPARGDLVLADRLIHHSMVAGLLRSGARLQRYAHLNLDQLEEQLTRAQPSVRTIFVVTESVFSMDGDYPDLARMAELKRRHGFCWIVDEAHALGWYGPEGAGLVRAAGVESAVDVLVGTLGKALAAGGAYTLFREEVARDYFVNTAGEFIYSTGFPPANAAAALAALGRVRALAGQQGEWHGYSRAFRAALQAAGWQAPAGESPVVPVRLDDEDAALALAGALREAGIYAAAVRPPTVPAGTSRLRFSLKRTFTRADLERVLAAMAAWRARR
jgi:8-amino-7-oxononanoate synthase